MKKQKELEARELDLVERELHLMIPTTKTPVPKKRRGKVSNKLLKVSALLHLQLLLYTLQCLCGNGREKGLIALL